MKGLTSSEVESLLKQYGRNMLQPPPKPGFLSIFLAQFNNFLSILLLIAAVLAIIAKEPVDGALIFAIVFLNALFGVYQEKKAEAAIEALSNMSITKVRVVRDGEEQEIDSRDLVPGDIMYLEEGGKVAADAKLVEAIQVEVNESALTGESLPVSRGAGEDIFMGTIIARGRGHAQVSNTGAHTKFGEIAANLSSIKEPKTPLQKKLESLSKAIGVIGIVASAIVFYLSYGNGTNTFESFLLAVSLAVAVVPEGLPAVLTMTLAIGVKEMAKRKAIVRKLSAVEAFGSVTLICTDKTGTLTTNKMRVKELYIGQKFLPSEQATSNPAVQQLFNCGILCATASLVEKDGSYEVLGDPTEGAPMILAEENGMSVEEVRSKWELVNEMPFDSVTKRMLVHVSPKSEVRSPASTEATAGEPKSYIYAKGAPESILSISSSILINGAVEKLTPERKEEVNRALMEWGRKGLRVMAFSYKEVTSPKSEVRSPAMSGEPNPHLLQNEKAAGSGLQDTDDLIFIGMVGIHDAPRPEVNEAIQKAHAAGIKVVMITGDNEITAEAIGRHVGLMADGGDIINGSEVERLTDDELLKKIQNVRIFARTTPFHKRRIVALYQKLGEVVAVTGDGVNDSIALKQSDVGLAMGITGTDVARETADIVIADDNFATIVNAIEEGRNIIKNVKNSIIYLLSCNIAEAMALIGGLILGLPALFLPIQLLYINLVTDGVPALALAYSPHEDRLMKEPPKKTLTLLQIPEYVRIFFQGTLATAFVFLAYYLYRNYLHIGGSASALTHEGAATAAFTVLALIQSFIFIDTWLEHRWLFNHLDRVKSKIFWIAFLMPFAAQAALLYVPFLSKLFKVEQVSIVNFALLLGMSSLIPVFLRLIGKKSEDTAK